MTSTLKHKVWGLFSALAVPTCLAGQMVALDHVPIAVNDLEGAVRDFTAMGFTIKPGRDHANSIRNAHVKFGDGTALELITAAEAGDAVAAAYVEFLRSGEGAAYASLTGGSPAGVAAELDGLDISYERVRGSYYEWLTFDGGSPYRFLFFGWITAPPSDPPGVFAHANGTERLEAIWIANDDVTSERALLEALGAPARETVTLPGGLAARIHRTARGSIYLGRMPGGSDARSVLGLTLVVPDLASVLPHIPGAVAGQDVRGRFARVAVHGVWLEFLERQGR